MLGTGKIGLGGSCHWCTEAIFQSLKGVFHVSQGWIRSARIPDNYSEAVIIEFDPDVIALETLIEIHLHTHSCTSEHSMRSKYRSAVYTFSEEQESLAKLAIKALQNGFEDPVITKVIPFGSFKLNSANYLDYYYNDPDKPFCKTFIDPKLKLLLNQFSGYVKDKKIADKPFS